MKTKWIFAALTSGMLAAAAIAAQPEPDRLAMSMPASAPASAQVPGAMDAAAVRAAIESANSEWLVAFRNGDSASLARIYAPDANLFPPTNVSLEGRDRIVEYFRAQRRAGMGDATLKTLDVVCVGDVAYEVGIYGFRFEAGVEDRSGDAGRYFAIWKEQPDGSWRYQVGIWSSNRDAASKP
jgi:ketosteroid isomerase-like protein